MPPSSSTVKYEVRDRVAWITLNRPQALNALSDELFNTLYEAIDEATADDDVLVIVLTREGGRAFSAGAELRELADQNASGKSTPSAWQPQLVQRCPEPTIAAIDGYCMAGAMALVNFCDFRIATEKSRFARVMSIDMPERG